MDFDVLPSSCMIILYLRLIFWAYFLLIDRDSRYIGLLYNNSLSVETQKGLTTSHFKISYILLPLTSLSLNIFSTSIKASCAGSFYPLLTRAEWSTMLTNINRSIFIALCPIQFVSFRKGTMFISKDLWEKETKKAVSKNTGRKIYIWS
jgi:hypothetical protein